MRRTTLLLLSVLHCAVSGFGQQTVPSTASFSFKGATLAMQMGEFRSLNKRDIWINTGDPGKRVNKSKSQLVSAPLCSDQYQFPGLIDPLDPPHPSEIVCVTSIQGFNSDARVVAGKEALSLRYHFYEGRLYKIAIGFYPLDFSPVLNAFTEKFGAPAHIGADAYQNAFGAKWEAAVVTWRKGRESVTLKESPAMGPGQDHYNSLRPTTAVFLQDDVKPPSVPGKVDF